MKNKAFTLIELLAVIVILAIITLIAVPIVLNIINNAKDSSVIRSTELYLDAVELYIARNQLDNNQIKDGQHNIGEFTKVEVNGQAPNEGMVELTTGKITDYSLQIGEYVVNYDETKKKPVIGGVLRKAEYKPIVDLVEGMTAVQYIDNNWKVVDETTKNWYNYNKQEWANAVILNSGVTKNIGDIVDVANEVKAMFVYIPRYEYKIEGQYGTHTDGTEGTVELPGEIKVNFVPKTKNGIDNEYRVHPAFTFGEEELNGIWVGKFETSTLKVNACYTSSSEANCDNKNQDPYIIPNVNSLRYQKVSNQFTTAQKFNSYVTNGDSHMMKNSEWGAVAYLSQSKYGKYGNSNYSRTEKEIRKNNCSNFITGVGADNQDVIVSAETCITNTYETEKGQTASTTGNITGVYDMSGGAAEYVMGYLSGVSSTWGASSASNYAGFTSEPDAKYYDSYTSTNTSSNSMELSKIACGEGVCYGHALSETSRWYGDFANFVSSSNPWFKRGGYCNNGLGAGLFSFNYDYGNAGTGNYSFRVVVSPTTD